MKKVFLFLMIIISALSCKKEVAAEDTMAEANVSHVKNSHGSESSLTESITVRVIWASYFNNIYQNCLSGYWYCWEITVPSDAKGYSSEIKDYININNDKRLITFGIDNSINPDYHKQFIKGSYFNFPQDTYIKRSIVNATIGLNKEIYVQKGLYPFKIIDGILTITAPYTISK